MGKYSVNKLLQSSRSVKERIAEDITYIRARGTGRRKAFHLTPSSSRSRRGNARSGPSCTPWPESGGRGSGRQPGWVTVSSPPLPWFLWASWQKRWVLERGVRENGSTEIVVPVLISPDRAPHGVTGEAEHPARKFDACAWQVVRVPTADNFFYF